jgi:predicted alpha/beta-hydrolase family hydrolase
MIVDRPASGRSPAVVVLAHGAGGHMDDRAMRTARDLLVALDVAVVRFNFPYREKGSSRPDAMPRLLDSWKDVVAQVRDERIADVLIVGGRSMGGRAASMLLAEAPTAADGLLLLAYPLHPPGHPEKLRAAHLPSIRQPVLCINGTRDDFCERRLMEQVLATAGSNWQMHWLDGADHGFHVLKRSGRTDADVVAEVRAAIDAWLGRFRQHRTA